jgi:hypothetical protein
MSWNYRIILHDLDPDPGKHWYGLHEVYYGMPDDPSIPGIGPTVNPTSFVCGSDEGKDAIIGALVMALEDLRDPCWGVVLTDSGMAQGIGREAGKTLDTPVAVVVEGAAVEVSVPDAEFRLPPAATEMWDAMGELISISQSTLGNDMAFSVLLSRLTRELRRLHGTDAATDVLRGLMATMTEAAQYDRS